MTNPSPTPSESSLPPFAEGPSPMDSSSSSSFPFSSSSPAPIPPSKSTTAQHQVPAGLSAIRRELTEQEPRQTGTLRIQLRGARKLKEPTPELVGLPPHRGLPPMKDFVLSIQHERDYYWESDPHMPASASAPMWNQTVEWTGVLYPPLDSVKMFITYRSRFGREVDTWEAEPVIGESWNMVTPRDMMWLHLRAPKCGRYVGELQCSFHFIPDNEAPLHYHPFWQNVGWWLTLPQHWVPQSLLPLKQRFDDGVDWCVEGLLYAARILYTTSPPDMPAFFRTSNVKIAMLFFFLAGVVASVASMGAAFFVLLALVFAPLTFLLLILCVLAMVGFGFPAFFVLAVGLTSPPVCQKLYQPFMRRLVKLPLMDQIFLAEKHLSSPAGAGANSLHQE